MKTVPQFFGENDLKDDLKDELKDDLKDEFGIDSSMLNQEPVSRDCHAIKTVCDPGNKEGTVMHEQALPSIYTLQPCNPCEVSTLFAYHL